MKKLLLMLLALVATSAWAQTDVTSTYLTNADFSEGPVITADIRGYGKDMVSGDVYGFQDVTGWTKVVTAADNSNASYPNSAMGGGVLAYGSTNQLKGNNVTAPAAGPSEGAANGLGFFGVWGCGGYYYQDVTLAAGKYKLTFPIYCISGTQANTTYTGFFPTSGTNRTVAINTTVGSWVNQTVEFTLAAETAGQIRLGYQSTGSGSGANPHLVFDGVKIEFTAVVVRDVLQTAISAATKANTALGGTLDAAIATAQAVYDDEDATQDEVNAAAEMLNNAVNTAMATASNIDVTDLFLTNANLSSTEGWTVNQSGNFRDQGNGLIGDYSVRFSAATVDETHLATEYCFGFEARWSGNFASYNQTTEALPAGVYTLTYDVENVNGATSNLTYADYNYVQVGETKNYSSTTEWMAAKSDWTTHTIRVTLNDAAPITVSFGYGTGSNNTPADNTPAIYVSHVKLNYSGFLAGAKAAWEEAKAAAQAAVDDEAYANVTGEERTALNAEIDKAEPTTVDGYNEASAALTAATTTFTTAKASYDAFYAIANSDYVTTLNYGTEEKRQALDEACSVEPTSAADAVVKTNAVYTALRTYYESHAMAENVEGAVDMTDRVSAANADTNTGWTNGIGTNQGQGYTAADGTVAAKYLDGGWAQNAGADIDMTRSVEIPAGKYLLTVTARGAAALDEYTLSIGGVTVNLPKNGGNGGVFGNGWDDVSVEFETDGSAQTLEVKATSTASQQWMSINRFRLVRLELFTEMANEEDYAALTAAIEAAEAKPLGFDEGEYAPYNNVEVIKAIATAKTIDSSLENEKAEVQALTEALTNSWTANTAEVDAIFDGQFATTEANTTSGDINLPGWTKVQGIRLLVKDEATDPGLAYTDGGAAVFAWGGTTLTYGEQEGYTLPMNKDELYELTLKVSGWRDGDLPNVVTIALDGVSQTVNAQELGAKAINVSEGNPFVTLKFYVTPTEDSSKLTIYANHHFTIADLSMKLAVAEEITLDETVAFEQAEETYANVTMNRKVVAGINAVAVPFDLTTEQVKAVFGENAQVYTFEDVPDGENSQINFNTKEENTIEANVPVLVGGATESTQQTINGVILKAGEAKVTGTNFDFVGNYAGTVKVAANDYFVSGGKLYKSEGNTNLKSFRAFIQNKANTNGNVKLCIDGVATSIEAIENGQLTIDNEAIYNLAGQRVSKATKGIYVINGRKVVVK
ncbi:MAG: hypothetical protein J6Y04_10010 [Bacteroidaceae bacterium]|nr:hypothetical protein [Bacteroidaceae bacterium]